MNKKQLQSEQTKKRIADAARALFIQKGYNATSIEDIVKETNCSPGNIYYHFKSKEGLFLHLIEESDKEWEQQWLVKESSYATTAEKLYAMAEYLSQEQLNQPLVKATDEFFNNSEKISDANERIQQLVANYVHFNEELLQKGMERGEFRNIDLNQLAVIMDSLLYGLSQHSRGMDQDESQALYRLAMDIFLYGIAKPQG